MKGTLGIVIAVGLGVIGFLCNWLYLDGQNQATRTVSFVGIAKEARVNRGHRFEEEDLTEIKVPTRLATRLREVAVLWDERGVAIGQRATREFGTLGTELLTHRDLETPTTRNLNEQIADNERVMWLPVDSRSFNPQHVNPGDEVSFRIPGFADTSGSKQKTAGGAGEIIGPFKILALGDRKGRRDIRLAAGLPTGAENRIAIAVKTVPLTGKLEVSAQKLANALAENDFKGVQLLLHPDTRKPAP